MPPCPADVRSPSAFQQPLADFQHGLGVAVLVFGQAGEIVFVPQAAGQEGVLPFDVPACAAYVPVAYPEITERRAFGWFLRMSEEQILESDLAISTLFRQVL